MKSIKQQYIDLREGRMTQQNFMRNLRMTMPQYVTNVTSYDDSIRILKNKGILVEADMNGPMSSNTEEEREMKSMLIKKYNMNPKELRIGIEVEMEHTDNPEVAEKIAMDHLAENPNYYSDLEQSGIDTPHDLKNEPGSPIQNLGSMDTTSSDVNLNKANPRDGFSLGYFEESQDETAAEELVDIILKFVKDPDEAEYYANQNPQEWPNYLSSNVERYYQDQKPHSGESGLSPSMNKLAKSLSNPFPQYKKSGIKESKDEKGKWTNADGKSMYAQFKEINNLNGQEVLIGIDYEMEKNEKLTKNEAAKIVIKNLKKNPIYYTAEDMSGVEGYEPEYMGGKSAQPEARQMQPLDKNMSNVVDKKMGMQPVKGIEKAKKDADARKETNTIEKEVEELTFIAKTVRGLQKMDATGSNMKKIAIKEAVNKALAKERLKEMIRKELKEITGAYGGDAMDAEDGTSYLENK